MSKTEQQSVDGTDDQSPDAKSNVFEGDPPEQHGFVYPFAESIPSSGTSTDQQVKTVPTGDTTELSSAQAQTPQVAHLSPFQKTDPARGTTAAHESARKTVLTELYGPDSPPASVTHSDVLSEIASSPHVDESASLVRTPLPAEPSTIPSVETAGGSGSRAGTGAADAIPTGVTQDPPTQPRSDRWPDVGPRVSRRTTFITALAALLGIGKVPDTPEASLGAAGKTGSLTANFSNAATGGESFVPSDFKIDSSATTFDIDWDGITGEKLYFELSVKPAYVAGASFDSIADGGVSIDTSSGSKTVTAGEIFDDSELFLTNHPQITADDFRVFEDGASLPNSPAVGSDDKYVTNTYDAEVTLNTVDGTTLVTKQNSFQIEYAVFGGFGQAFGYNFGKEQIKDFPHLNDIAGTTTIVEGGTVDVAVHNAYGASTEWEPHMFEIDSQVTEFTISWQDLTPGEILLVEVSMRPLSPSTATFSKLGEGGFSVTEATGSEALDAEYLFSGEQMDLTNNPDISLADFRVFPDAEDMADSWTHLQNMTPSDKTVVNSYEIRVELKTTTQIIGSQTAQFKIEYGALAGGNLEYFGYNFDREQPEIYPSV